MQKIGIGYENYKEFIDDTMYYVDKTLLIRDILEKGGKVNLFTRPRRFGKTLALSMIRTFFELEYNYDGIEIDKEHYFSGKKIMDCGSSIISKIGKFPVITLSLKPAKKADFQNAFFKLREAIIREYDRHSYLADSAALDEKDKATFQKILNGEVIWDNKVKNITDAKDLEQAFAAECGLYSTSLLTLSILLKKHHHQNAIILLDEYDVPLYVAVTSYVKSI